MALCRVVTEIFDVEKYSDLEIRVPGDSIAIVDLSRTVFEINGDFSRKSPNYSTPVYSKPR